MKSRSAKNKGKRLQNKIRDLILEKFDSLESDDVRSITMGDSGEDIGGWGGDGGGGDGGVIMIPTGKSMSSHLATLQLQSLYAS